VGAPARPGFGTQSGRPGVRRARGHASAAHEQPGRDPLVLDPRLPREDGRVPQPLHGVHLPTASAPAAGRGLPGPLDLLRRVLRRLPLRDGGRPPRRAQAGDKTATDELDIGDKSPIELGQRVYGVQVRHLPLVDGSANTGPDLAQPLRLRAAHRRRHDRCSATRTTSASRSSTRVRRSTRGTPNQMPSLPGPALEHSSTASSQYMKSLSDRGKGTSREGAEGEGAAARRSGRDVRRRRRHRRARGCDRRRRYVPEGPAFRGRARADRLSNRGRSIPMTTIDRPTDLPATTAHHGHDGPYLTSPRAACSPTILNWATTVDHKKIGVMYLFAVLFMFFLGGVAALAVRMELLEPVRMVEVNAAGRPTVVTGQLFGADPEDVARWSNNTTTACSPCTARSWCSCSSCRDPGEPGQLLPADHARRQGRRVPAAEPVELVHLRLRLDLRRAIDHRWAASTRAGRSTPPTRRPPTRTTGACSS
jgi:hypothetical protein